MDRVLPILFNCDDFCCRDYCCKTVHTYLFIYSFSLTDENRISPTYHYALSCIYFSKLGILFAPIKLAVPALLMLSLTISPIFFFQTQEQMTKQQVIFIYWLSRLICRDLCMQYQLEFLRSLQEIQLQQESLKLQLEMK